MVHKLLASKRLTEGSSSIEWFDVSFDAAMLAVRLAIGFSECETSSRRVEIQP
jgi:hypothetical protein